MPTAPPVPVRPIDRSFGSLEPHGARRRRQLVRAAAHVIEYEGLDALRMPRVAELAGCARTLVYRYFPDRDALLKGVVSEYYETLEAELDRRRREYPTPEADVLGSPLGASIEMFDVAFDVITELGLAGLMLRTSAHVSADVRQHTIKESARFGRRWVVPLREAGLSDLHAAIASEAGVAVLVEAVHRWQVGELTREEAVELNRVSCLGLLAALVEQYGQ